MRLNFGYANGVNYESEASEQAKISTVFISGPDTRVPNTFGVLSFPSDVAIIGDGGHGIGHLLRIDSGQSPSDSPPPLKLNNFSLDRIYTNLGIGTYSLLKISYIF